MTDDEMVKLAEKVAIILAEREKDKTPKEPYWGVKNITIMLGVISTFLTSVAGLSVGLLNKDRNEQMLIGQNAAVAVAEDVRTKLDVTTDKQEKQSNRVQKAVEAVEDAQGPQLFITWKRLEEDADYARTNGLKDAKLYEQKAADAKAKFDAYTARQKNPKS